MRPHITDTASCCSGFPGPKTAPAGIAEAANHLRFYSRLGWGALSGSSESTPERESGSSRLQQGEKPLAVLLSTPLVFPHYFQHSLSFTRVSVLLLQGDNQ